MAEISKLRQAMMNRMALRGFAERTCEPYLMWVKALDRHYGCSPARLSTDQIQAYLLHLINDKKLANASVNQASCAFRFLFCEVLQRPSMRLDIPMAKVPMRLPQILSRTQIPRLFEACTSVRGCLLLKIAYASGLRVSELCHLQVVDIESDPDRMCIKVRHGKGGKDRYTILSPTLLTDLRAYWSLTRPGLWLFPNPDGSRSIDIKTVQRIYCAARDAAKLPNNGGIHTLRHSFATHMLESSVDLHTIQRLLGHGHISTTMRYLHLAQAKLTGNTSPLDLLVPV